jgi:hypothetical protein
LTEDGSVLNAIHYPSLTPAVLHTPLPTGFTDIQTLQSDPDLRPIQGPELNALINK